MTAHFARTALLAVMLTAAAPAFSQDAEPAATPADDNAPSTLSSGFMLEIDDEDLVVEPFNVTIGELDGMTLFGSDGSQFGEIEAILGDSAGKVAALAVEIGGFLGVGNRELILPISEVTPDGLRLTVNITSVDMEAHPFWGN